MKELTVTIFANGIQTDRLTDEQRKNLSQKMSEAMSIYYSNHAAGRKKTEKDEKSKKQVEKG